MEHSRSPSDDGVAAVAEHLHLDVARPADVALDVDRRVAEAGLRLGTRGRQLGEQSRRDPRRSSCRARHRRRRP